MSCCSRARMRSSTEGAGRSGVRWPGPSPARGRGCSWPAAPWPAWISHGDVQGARFVEMALEDYLRPVDTAVRTTFLTSRAAGRRMVRQGAGVILAFGGSGDPPRDYYLGGLQAVRDPADRGVPETIPPGVEGMEAVVADIERQTMLGRRPGWRTPATWPPSWPRTGPHHDRGHRQPQLRGPERLRDSCLQAASGRAIWEVRSLPLAVVAASRLG